AEPLLRADAEWVGINPAVGLWLDVAVLEQAYHRVQGVPGRQLEGKSLEAVREAVWHYQGDLLEGCYLDWCLSERERLQQIHLSLLDKLMDHCQAEHDYEMGLAYGMQILRIDRASERTHRRM